MCLCNTDSEIHYYHLALMHRTFRTWWFIIWKWSCQVARLESDLSERRICSPWCSLASCSLTTIIWCTPHQLAISEKHVPWLSLHSIPHCMLIPHWNCLGREIWHWQFGAVEMWTSTDRFQYALFISTPLTLYTLYLCSTKILCGSMSGCLFSSCRGYNASQAAHQHSRNGLFREGMGKRILQAIFALIVMPK